MKAMSNPCDQVCEALAKFQALAGLTVERVQENTYFHSQYTPGDYVAKCIAKYLSECSLGYSQSLELSGNEWIICTTTIFHSSGQWIQVSAPVPCFRHKETKHGDVSGIVVNPHTTGSAITYARRYSLMAALGLWATNEDDDGNMASMTTERVQQQQTPKTQNDIEGVVKVLVDKINRNPTMTISDLARIASYHGVDSAVAQKMASYVYIEHRIKTGASADEVKALIRESDLSQQRKDMLLDQLARRA